MLIGITVTKMLFLKYNNTTCRNSNSHKPFLWHNINTPIKIKSMSVYVFMSHSVAFLFSFKHTHKHNNNDKDRIAF